MNLYKPYIKKYGLMFFTAVLCVFWEAVCDLMQPTIMARLIDEGVKNHRMDTVINLGLLMLLITALGAVFAAVRNVLASKVSQGFGADLRSRLFEKILKFSEVSADKIESGSLITRLTNDTTQITQFINGLMRIFVKAPITCVGSIVLAVLLSVRLSVILFLAVTIVAVFIFISMKLSYIRFARVQAAIDRVNTIVQEYLMGVRLVKAFGRYEEEKQKFGGANQDLAQKSLSSQLVIVLFAPLMSLTVGLGIAGILYLGSILFGLGTLEVGKIAAFINYMIQILASLIMITNVFNTFVRTRASTERVMEVLSSGEDFPGSDQSGDLHAGTISFDHVTFAYPSGSGIPAVRDLSFSIGRGQTMAVIGPTGAGKSTLAWLLMRFYDADDGKILLDGVNIKELDTIALRAAISLAPQKSMLFTGTVLQNLMWGNPDATRDEAEKAARLAMADEFIRGMPQQYDSMLGQGGVNLSGGQKQRVSIARALLKKADVLILDDCTSALDAITEAKVRRGIKTLEGDKTVILITQRIGTAMYADRILVMDNGEKVGFGSHRELLSSCGTYREIYDSQIGEEVVQHG